ncbi:MAG: 2,3,4,5-tetrahydropyridine-2,6-dicarboxylate N-succinyltransferase [Thermoanaerobaculia bacterium]|nr:2,3,4,5-tetrahydropyridine-2,6-dicarboxylate N-succinyltransferase [Thermoanaerobaculia bacterium]MCK6684320.1 2,3,4,5-tetrahydropyridine-2,6-dicarboxylate N-succinyltransferase [Thermoanaerobaculia bacterium]
MNREEVLELLASLEKGERRAALQGPDGAWHADAEVKEGILFAFRLGVEVESEAGPFWFRDRDTVPPRRDFGPGVRIVPGGSTVRRGAYLGKGVVMMPPSYVNVGAHVDDGTMIDSHALVGSCAQIGKRVHLSAAAQIGGVLEPANARPVIIEDEVFVGGGVGVYEGVLVRKRAVLASGVILTGSTVIFDLVNETEIRGREGEPLAVPEGAVVVPGSRKAPGDFAARNGIALATPVIVKYRDARTDSKTALEWTLRRS